VAIIVNFAGASLLTPGAYSRVQVVPSGAAQAQLGIVAILGESSAGLPFSEESGVSAVTWAPTQYPQILAKYGSGQLVDGAKLSFAPSNDPQILGGAQQLITMKTNQSVAASLTFGLGQLVVNFTALLGKLDNDAGVSDTNYAALLTPAPTLPSIITNFNALLTKLDSDTGVADTNYSSLLSVLPSATLVQVETNFNSLLTKLDNDAGVADTNYNALLAVIVAPTYGVVTAQSPGVQGNQISVEIDAILGQDIITITDNNTGTQEISGPLGGDGALTLQVTGVGVTAATLTITPTNIITTVTGGTTPSLNIPKTQFTTLSQLVTFMNAQAGYVATAINNHQNDPLSVLDQVTALNVFTSVATVNKDAADVAAFFALSSLVTFTQLTFVGIPTPIVKTFLTGGLLGGTTQANFQQALDALSTTRVNFVIPLFSQDATADIALGNTDPTSTYQIASIQAAIQTHCAQNSTVKGRRERQGYVANLGSYQAAKTASANLGSARVSLQFQQIDIANSQGTLYTAQPHMLALINGTMKAAAVVGLPNTFKLVNINGFSVPDKDFDPETQSDDAIQNNLTFIERAPGGGFRFVLDNSTYGQTLDAWIFSRPAVLYAADVLSFSIRLNMETFVGQRNSDISTETVKNLLISVLDGARSSGIIVPDTATAGKGFKDLVVTINGSVINTSVTVALVEGIEFVLSNIQVQEAVF
jgi:hypothetical protein